MTPRFRNTIAVLVLLAGIAWSLPMDRGRTGNEPLPATYSAADSAEFEISSFRGALTISGHARSRDHEARIMDAVHEFYPSHVLHVDLHPLGVAPAWWDDATVELIESLAVMTSPQAHLTEDALRIEALVTDQPAVERQLQGLRRELPSSADTDFRIKAVATQARASTFCEQQFAEFRAGPVAFEESGTRMRTSAYPVLDNVVALAYACRGATITITGHSDASGNEDSNQRLSAARARVVADFLHSRGIARQRLIAVGAGSLLPIADNATRYGRSINRRIEIQFTATSD